MCRILINYIDLIIMAVSVGNWTSIIQDLVKGKESVSYVIGQGGLDPSVGCLKDFTASYKCGNFPTSRAVNIPGDAQGKTARFDCSSESKMCKGFRLTLGDDGNLILTDSDNKQIWTSNTNKIGFAVDKFNAKNGKYGRNYLLAGESLRLGEFIGSPSGNCYLIMNETAEGSGLELKYSVTNCDDSQYGNDEMTNGLFSMAKSAYNQLIGTTNKINPDISKLNNTLTTLVAEENKIDVNDNVRDYAGIQRATPVIKKRIEQLDAMGEDTGLSLVAYRYRRILWIILAILVVLGGIKLARNSSD